MTEIKGFKKGQQRIDTLHLSCLLSFIKIIVKMNFKWKSGI